MSSCSLASSLHVIAGSGWPVQWSLIEFKPFFFCLGIGLDFRLIAMVRNGAIWLLQLYMFILYITRLPRHHKPPSNPRTEHYAPLCTADIQYWYNSASLHTFIFHSLHFLRSGANWDREIKSVTFNLPRILEAMVSHCAPSSALVLSLDHGQEKMS